MAVFVMQPFTLSPALVVRTNNPYESLYIALVSMGYLLILYIFHDMVCSGVHIPTMIYLTFYL